MPTCMAQKLATDLTCFAASNFWCLPWYPEPGCDKIISGLSTMPHDSATTVVLISLIAIGLCLWTLPSPREYSTCPWGEPECFSMPASHPVAFPFASSGLLSWHPLATDMSRSFCTLSLTLCPSGDDKSRIRHHLLILLYLKITPNGLE